MRGALGAFGLEGTFAIAGAEQTDSSPSESTVVTQYVKLAPAETVVSVYVRPALRAAFTFAKFVAFDGER